MATLERNGSHWPLALAIIAALAVNLCAVVAIGYLPNAWLATHGDEEELPPVKLVFASPMRHFDDDSGFNRAEPAVLPLIIENNLPTDLFDSIQPDPTKLNGLRDAEEGGTFLRPEGPRSGGGGGDAEQSIDFGHIESNDRAWSRLKWKPDPSATAKAAGTADGTGASVPGTQKIPGNGNGLGNGTGSGALGSQGSGTGSGAGVNGSNAGPGLGTAAPPPVTHRPGLLSRSEPAYPNEARVAGHSGTVLVSLEVLPSGDVGQVEVKTSSGYSELDRAALGAAKNYRFTGAVNDGKPVSFWYVVPFRFALTEY